MEKALSNIPIYTIGYGNRSITDFIELLKRYGIQYLVDVRSQPYSRYNPDFSKDALERHLKRYHIRYIFMGDTLGGRPEDSSSRTDDNGVDYALLYKKDFYQRGIDRLYMAWKKELLTAIMCSELKPQECHRGKLIGNTLIDRQIEVAHIDENGEIKDQDEVNSAITGIRGEQLTLFDKETVDEDETGDDINGVPLILLNKKVRYSRKSYPLEKESA